MIAQLQALKTATATKLADFWFWLTAPRWYIAVMVLDQIDFNEKVSIPIKEVARFLRIEPKFYLVPKFYFFNDTHPYSGPFGPENRYFLHWPEIPAKWLLQITEPCDAVVVLYKLNGRLPLQLGSTFALAQGVPIHGKLRIYTSIPVDNEYFVSEPYQGFNCRSGQILAHEIDNGIRGTVGESPYNCTLFAAHDGDPSWKYETDRVHLDDACYAAIRKYKP